MESGEMQPDRALVPGTAPLFETINVSKSFGAFKALRNISFGVSDASLSLSSDQTGPARPRWLMSSPVCCGRPLEKFASWAAISPA
jgi:hypothetical protein